jgi:hypothetical protein
MIMKKILLLTIASIMLACSKDEVQSAKATQDCDCDRVVEVNTFNVVGTPQNPITNFYSIITTVNDCTQIQRQKSSNTTIQSQIPKVGDCK